MNKILFRDRSLNDFLDMLASSSPIPGGGPLAALLGAQACALGEMVCNITLSNKKYANIKDEVRAVLAELFSARSKFLTLMEKDADGFSSLMDTLQMSRDSFESDSHRKKILDEAFKNSAFAPIQVAKLCISLIPSFVFILEKGNKNLLSDSVIAANTLVSCLSCAVQNVRVNANCVSDKTYVENINVLIKEWFLDMDTLKNSLNAKHV